MLLEERKIAIITVINFRQKITNSLNILKYKYHKHLEDLYPKYINPNFILIDLSFFNDFLSFNRKIKTEIGRTKTIKVNFIESYSKVLRK